MEHLAGHLPLFVAVLKDLELQDWSLLSACSRWSRHAVSDAKPILRRYHRCEAAGARSLEDICGAADVTGLWAALTSDEGPALSINMQLLHSSLSLPTTHAASFDPENYHLPGELSSGRRLELLNLWLLAQANAPSVVRTQTIYKQQALHVCARHAPPTKVIQRVLDLLPDLVDGKDSWESTPLVEAVRQEHLEVVQCLLAGGANPNALVPNCHGDIDTPLILAVRLRNEELVRQLVNHPDIDLHQKEDHPNAKEALDFAPAESPVRSLLEEAIARRRGIIVRSLLEAAMAGRKESPDERSFMQRQLSADICHDYIEFHSENSTMSYLPDVSSLSSKSSRSSSYNSLEDFPSGLVLSPDSDISTMSLSKSSRSSSFCSIEGSETHLSDVKAGAMEDTVSCWETLRWMVGRP